MSLKNVSSGILFSFVTVMLLGCSTGVPTSSENVPANLQQQFPECVFVETAGAPVAPILGAYLTTMGSSLAEGAAAGYYTSAYTRPPDRPPHSFRVGNASLVRTQNIPTSFCALFAREPQAVSRSVGQALRTMQPAGYGISEAAGGFRTTWRSGEHAAARWLDRYLVDVRAAGAGQTVVVIRREVYIQRREARNRIEGGNFYFRGQSSGTNEWWLAGEIARRLR